MWISTKDWADGKYNLPSMSEETQNYIRSKKRIQYTKLGRRVVYKKEWIEDYINSNIREAITKQEQINENNRA